MQIDKIVRIEPLSEIESKLGLTEDQAIALKLRRHEMVKLNPVFELTQRDVDKIKNK